MITHFLWERTILEKFLQCRLSGWPRRVHTHWAENITSYANPGAIKIWSLPVFKNIYVSMQKSIWILFNLFYVNIDGTYVHTVWHFIGRSDQIYLMRSIMWDSQLIPPSCSLANILWSLPSTKLLHCKKKQKPIDLTCNIICMRPLITDTQTNTLDCNDPTLLWIIAAVIALWRVIQKKSGSAPRPPPPPHVGRGRTHPPPPSPMSPGLPR